MEGLNTKNLKNQNTQLCFDLDSELLLSFLSRPRTILEVAEHFDIPVGLAERLVVDAVESGKVLLSSRPAKGIPPTFTVERGHTKEILSFSSRALPTGTRGKLPRVLAPKVLSRMNLNDYSRLLFKIRGAEPTPLRRSSTPLVPSELFRRRERHARKSGRTSFSLEMSLLETLQKGPRPLMELRARLGVSRSALERLVRRGMLRQMWGPKDVGIFFEMTNKGVEEFKRLRAASRVDAGLLRKPLISLKTGTAH